MGRTPCCDKVGLKKGPWTPEEDQKLLAYIDKHGHGSWRALPAKAGLQRCGKSCRLRWTNYLRPDIKRGKFSLQEEQTIIQLHALLGNRWSAIATHLPKRTDNEIKNYWNTHLKKRLAKMGIDPVTHKPQNDPLLSPAAARSTKAAAALSHMAQWETARLEAEARLARQSKLRSSNPATPLPPPPPPPRCLDILNVRQPGGCGGGELESPTTSTVSYCENAASAAAAGAAGGVGSAAAMIDFVGSCSGRSPADGDGAVKEEEEGGGVDDWKIAISYGSSEMNDVAVSLEGPWTPESLKAVSEGHVADEHFVEGFTGLLLSQQSEAAEDDRRSEETAGSGGGGGGSGGDLFEDNKNYWNSILNLVNSSPAKEPIF